MEKIIENNLAQAYYSGILAAYIDSEYMSWPISEGQIDLIKENISHFCETRIDDTRLSYQEKKEQKRQMKQSLEVYIQGVKDEMRTKERMK